MSSLESICGIRARIPALEGKSRGEAYEYFRKILGDTKPSNIDIWGGKEGTVEYFCYDGDYQPKREYSYGETNDTHWVVDRIFKADLNDSGFYLSLLDIRLETDKLKSMFGVSDEDIMVISYLWYNGSDEPVLSAPPSKE